MFVVVYLGMLLGEIPGLALDRTGVALLGALALVATERVTPAAAWAAVDVPTLALRSAGVDLGDMRWLFPATAVLSNLVSNVPAVMLLLPHASHPLAGPILALSSTLAGNLLIVGSIANIIVVDQAASLGIRIGWREHARVGIPVTLATLAIAAAWLAFRAS